jgi:hypothetical protein
MTPEVAAAGDGHGCHKPAIPQVANPTNRHHMMSSADDLVMKRRPGQSEGLIYKS